MQMTLAADADYAFLSRLDLPARGGTTDHVQAILREAIVSGDLAPGAAIRKQAVCDRLGVSRFPVSEALARLQAEGLVEILPQRGTRVTRIRISDVRESMFLRRALEVETVRQIARDPGPATLEAIGRSMRYQSAAIEAGDAAGFHALDVEFHRLLSDSLAYPRVRATVEAARGNLERIRRLLSGPWRHRATYDEHAGIVAGIEARVPDRAASAMTAHLDMVMAELVRYGKEHPDVFDDEDRG